MKVKVTPCLMYSDPETSHYEKKIRGGFPAVVSGPSKFPT